MQINSIFVVYDPTSDAQPALERAALIAQTEGPDVQLHLFSCIYSEIPKSEEKSGEVDRLVDAQAEILSSVIAPLVEQGIRVSTEIKWKKNWYKAVVRAAARHNADAVFKASHKHSATQRLFKKTSDWTLIRECSCPVLLVKRGVKSGAPKVLTAIDVRGDKDSYEEVNKNILSFCKRFVDAEHAEVHFITAYKDLPSRPDRGSMVRACGVQSDKVHIELGEPVKVIVDKAKALDANLVVIGNSARSGLSAVVNSNTAEKILDELECDLLAIP